jgi:hypothetical protein
LQQVELAVNGTYVELVREKQTASRLGLPKKALELLGAIVPADLKENERYAHLRLRMDLSLNTGRVGNLQEVAGLLRDEQFRKTLGPMAVAQYQISVGGALGDYELIEEGTLAFEKQFRAELRDQISALLPGVVVGSSLNLEENRIGTIIFQTAIRLNRLQERQNELFNVMTLRGIAALEAGETKKACDIFQAVVDESAGLRFTDRAIAVRYAQLLNEQWKK